MIAKKGYANEKNGKLNINKVNKKNYLNITDSPAFMTDLVACLTNKKGIFEHVKHVIDDVEWQNIYIFTSERDISKMKFSKQTKIINLDLSKTISELTSFIKTQLEGKLNDLEVAVNIVAGSGKEHTALLSAILKLGFGVRFVVLTRNGVKTI